MQLLLCFRRSFMRLLIILIAVVVVGGGGWLGQKVPFAVQWPMFEALRTTAAIIFAVIGAWMAIIYPERLKLSFKDPSATTPGKADAAGELFTPVINSTSILVIVLGIGVVAPLVKTIGLPGPVAIWRGVSYAILIALTLWQIWTVMLTVDPADRIKSFMSKELRHQRNVEAYRNKP